MLRSPSAVLSQKEVVIIPKLTDIEKERRAAERAAERAEKARIEREASVKARFENIFRRLDAKHVSRERSPDVYRLFEYLQQQALRGDLDPSLLRTHLRQEGLS